MRKILVTGATGQIGSELVPALRTKYGAENVIVAGHRRTPPSTLGYGPYTTIDVTKYDQIENAIRDYGITHIFHLASLLSGEAEEHPEVAWDVNFNGTHNVLEVARKNGVKQVVYPSSIAAFGPETPRDNTPLLTIQRPKYLYGISKVAGELLGYWYHGKYGLDVRGVRFPGIISWKEELKLLLDGLPPGTTDYAVLIYYAALKEGEYTSYLKPNTALPMMYMPDAIKALIDLSEADGSRLRHRTDFNVNAMSFTPEELASSIRRRIPAFKMHYQVVPKKQAIADSWPRSLDDSEAREEWGWEPSYDIDSMTDDMLENLKRKLQLEVMIPGR
ncbi:MAG: NAD-dependent epimerase/dehydratase family protein [Candidatus Aenigmarchaeota archaeon]|nr:NAD-dependent epimerase/dehydratase family protein [Candidatus Aenigmarchaeota archaeon]